MRRRTFLRLVGGGAIGAGTRRLDAAAKAKTARTGGPSSLPDLDRIRTFDHGSVALRPGPFADRLDLLRTYLLGVPNDDLLKGYRRAAGLPAPGRHLGGLWGKGSSTIVFGQWLSGMARLWRATRDAALLDKAVFLLDEFAKVAPSVRAGTYGYDKFVCGLVDMAWYAERTEAIAVLDVLTDRAEKSLPRANALPNPSDPDGRMNGSGHEWYTLPENLYRAYVLTGNERYRAFGDLWHYDAFWNQFAEPSASITYGVHAYSHLNTLSSAAMLYAVTGQKRYLRIIEHAHDWFVKTQCFSTGGFGPGERLVRPGGSLGRSIENWKNPVLDALAPGASAEIGCGTWAVFKLCTYLQRFTGEARYGDWAERCLYNGLGASLPLAPRGKTFYYADYRLKRPRKRYFPHDFPCCAGTYVQDVAAVHDLIYRFDDRGLYVSQYVPSDLTWHHQGRTIGVCLKTDYPGDEAIYVEFTLDAPTAFALRLRIPGWSEGATVAINGNRANVEARPGTWAEVSRTWKSGDRITLRIPQPLRTESVDKAHPRRVVNVRGAVVMVRLERKDHTYGPLIPFYAAPEGVPYLMYRDLCGAFGARPGSRR